MAIVPRRAIGVCPKRRSTLTGFAPSRINNWGAGNSDHTLREEDYSVITFARDLRGAMRALNFKDWDELPLHNFPWKLRRPKSSGIINPGPVGWEEPM